MLFCSEALLISHQPITGGKTLIRLFTRDRGMVSAISAGVFRKKSGMAGLMNPMQLLEVHIRLKNNRHLHSIISMQLLKARHNLLMHPVKLSQTMFLAELISMSLQDEEHPNEPLFDYISQALDWLDGASKDFSTFHVWVMLSLTRFLGFFPVLDNFDLQTPYFHLINGQFQSHPDEHCLDLASSKLLALMLQGNHTVPMPELENRQSRRTVVYWLERFYQCHLPGFRPLKTPELFASVFG